VPEPDATPPEPVLRPSPPPTPQPAPIPPRAAAPVKQAAAAPPPAAPPPARSPVAEAVAELVDENEPLGRIRRCILDALYMDPTPFGFRAAMRVRAARTVAAMIEIVWEMERDMSHLNRSRAGLQNLQRARELLGLGNTLVDEESLPDRHEDDAW
jgi:hypothetical protein